MRKHKYLEDLGINRRDCPGNWYKCTLSGKFYEWKHNHKYGFPTSDCWDLDVTFYCWLYEHLRAYKDATFGVCGLEDNKFMYNNKEYTQIELIDKIIEDLEWLLCDETAYFPPKLADEPRIQGIAEMWAIILPAMWW